VTRLGRGVDKQLRLQLINQVANAVTVTDVEFAMREFAAGVFQPFLVPSGISCGAEKLGTHVVVNAHNMPAPAIEMGYDFGTDEPVGTRYQDGGHTTFRKKGRHTIWAIVYPLAASGMRHEAWGLRLDGANCQFLRA